MTTTPDTTPTIKPGDHVQHRVKYQAVVGWVGFVLETATITGIGWTRRSVTVRWINDNGDSSDGTVTHAPEELEIADP